MKNEFFFVLSGEINVVLISVAVVTTVKVRTVRQPARHETDHAAVIVELVVEEAELPIITIAKKGFFLMFLNFHGPKNSKQKSFSVLAVVRLDHVNHRKPPTNRPMKHQNVITTKNATGHPTGTGIAVTVIAIVTVTIDLVIEYFFFLLVSTCV